MDQQQIHDRLTVIFRRVFKQPGLELKAGLTASDVDGWDSLNHIALISEIEEDFKIKFKLRDLMNMENVGDLLALITGKLAQV